MMYHFLQEVWQCILQNIVIAVNIADANSILMGKIFLLLMCLKCTDTFLLKTILIHAIIRLGTESLHLREKTAVVIVKQGNDTHLQGVPLNNIFVHENERDIYSKWNVGTSPQKYSYYKNCFLVVKVIYLTWL